MRLSPRSRTYGSSTRPDEHGYILITLILFVALLAIAMTALAPVIAQQVKRDREEELIHRGTQYSRAIKHYMKKFSRYPTRIEDLEETNNIRFLRKRYKDPVTGKDFKLLRQTDVQMSTGPGIAGATSVANMAGGTTTPFGGSGVFGGGPTGNSGGAFGGNSGGNSGGLFGGNSGGAFGGNSGGAPGGNAGGAFGGNSGGLFGGNAPNPPGGGNAGQNSSGNSDNGSDVEPNQLQGGAPNGQSNFGQRVQQLPGFGNQENGNQVFGGGPVVGVASISKDKSIRSFNKKDHYKDWQFIYDPTADRGGLITTPYQPAAISGTQNLNGTPGTNGMPGTSGAPGAPRSSFGFGGGQQNGPAGGMAPTPQQPQMPQMPPDQGPPQ
jgi:type II secretory pathway pseudopilin PulG